MDINGKQFLEHAMVIDSTLSSPSTYSLALLPNKAQYNTHINAITRPCLPQFPDSWKCWPNYM